MHFGKNPQENERDRCAQAWRHRWGRRLACFAVMAVLACAAQPGRMASMTGSASADGAVQAQRFPVVPAAAASQASALGEPPQAATAQTQPSQTKPAGRQDAPEVDLRKMQIAGDSAKLLSLATELKSEVDKSTKDMLSVGVIRRADEIEKLARSLREQMRPSPGGM
jgi:hypothetical protein